MTQQFQSVFLPPGSNKIAGAFKVM
jgi:hypothetical protein